MDFDGMFSRLVSMSEYNRGLMGLGRDMHSIYYLYMTYISKQLKLYSNQPLQMHSCNVAAACLHGFNPTNRLHVLLWVNVDTDSKQQAAAYHRSAPLDR